MSEPAKDEAELAETMARWMAVHFAMNRQPHMSGDPLNLLSVIERRRLDDATAAALAGIRAAGWTVVPVTVMDEVSTLIASTYSHVDGRDLLGELHPRNTLDIKRRVDGMDTFHEGDWLSEVMHCRNRLINLLAAAPGVKP